MKRKKMLAVSLVLLVILLLAGLAFAQASPNFDGAWSRFASGGGTRQSEHTQVQDILGQWVSQSPVSTNAQIVTDFFWAGDAIPVRLYLPLVRH
jgi:hypothetical protein